MKDSYEKAILGVAATAAVGLTAFGVLKFLKVDEDFTELSSGSKKAKPIETEGILTRAQETFSNPVGIGAVKTATGREVNAFKSVNLFVKRGAPITESIDIEHPDSPQVHDGIPNSWWLEHGLQEDMSYADGPQRDSDGDGFSNFDESKAGTLPNDKNSFPSLFAKVRVAELRAQKWVLIPRSFEGNDCRFEIISIIDGKRVETRVPIGKDLAPGSAFFSEGPFANRFKFVEIQEIAKDNGLTERFALVEEQAQKQHKMKVGKKFGGEDYFATIYLATPAEEAKTLELAEGQSFSLPLDKDAAEKPYTFKEVRNGGAEVVITWDNNGEIKELVLRPEK